VTPEAQNRAIQAELDQLVSLDVVAPGERARIGERYPTGPVDLGALARWFTWLGAVAVAVGAALVAHELSTGWLIRNKWLVIEGGLFLAGAGCIAGGLWLGRRRGLPTAGAALELLGAMGLQGLVVALAVHHSTDSNGWPTLVAMLTMFGAVLAYALSNRLVLVLAGAEAFFWFGAALGYEWGGWWLGMSSPGRFLVAGLVFLGVAWFHARAVRPPWQGFARVYAHLGLLDVHLALWFLAVFGWYDERQWDGTEVQRLLFTLVWALVSLGCVWAASKVGLRMLRSYGLTFLLVNVYTFYFQFVAWQSGRVWYLHLLVLGGALVGGGIWLERMLRKKEPEAAPEA
jgi:hypothetical protein